MVNLNTPVQLFKGHNEVPGNILYDADEKGERRRVIATFLQMKQEEKEEIIKRINDFPKLVKLAIDLVDKQAKIDLFEEDKNAESIADADEAFEKLKGFVHNFSRKQIDKDGYK